MHIALIRQRYAADGGAERFVARALAALTAQKVAVTLIAREWRQAAGFDVVRCNPFYLGSLWRDYGFARHACRAVQGLKVDLVQSHERLSCCDIYRAGDGVHREWLRQRARALSPWGKLRLALSPYHHYVKAAERALFASSRLRAVICNSHMVKDEIRHHFGVTPEKLHVIYSGVDTQTFHPDLKRHRRMVRDAYVIPDSATLFLFVGSGFERKGLGVLLQVLARLPETAHLLVVGRDKKLTAFTGRTRKLRLSGRVHFAGPQPDVGPYYGAADALVLPSLYDPFPNVILEAMAAGLPVITSTKCGGAELIVAGENGYVCDALDQTKMAECLQALCVPERRQRMSAAARTTVAPLTLEAMAQKLIALYEQMRNEVHR